MSQREVIVLAVSIPALIAIFAFVALQSGIAHALISFGVIASGAVSGAAFGRRRANRR